MAATSSMWRPCSPRGLSLTITLRCSHPSSERSLPSFHFQICIVSPTVFHLPSKCHFVAIFFSNLFLPITPLLSLPLSLTFFDQQPSSNPKVKGPMPRALNPSLSLSLSPSDTFHQQTYNTPFLHVSSLPPYSPYSPYFLIFAHICFVLGDW